MAKKVLYPHIPKRKSKKPGRKLRDLIDEFGATGVIRIDAGNGSAGPTWIEWDDNMDIELGDTLMYPVNPSDRAYEGNGEYANMDTIG